jgi:hypothetical protein
VETGIGGKGKGLLLVFWSWVMIVLCNHPFQNIKYNTNKIKLKVIDKIMKNMKTV